VILLQYKIFTLTIMQSMLLYPIANAR